MVRLAAIVLAALLAGSATSRAEEKPIPPCREDAMVVFDASGSMSGNETLGIPNSRARIDEARSALAQVLPRGAWEVMYRVATQTTYPSLGYQVMQGATSI